MIPGSAKSVFYHWQSKLNEMKDNYVDNQCKWADTRGQLPAFTKLCTCHDVDVLVLLLKSVYLLTSLTSFSNAIS